MSFIRIDKFLSNMGVGSRKQVKEYIKKGRILIDDEVCIKVDTKLSVKENTVKIDRKVVEYNKYSYIMLNKPKGVVSATEDKNEKTVIELLNKEDKKYKLFPVGRLDKDTEGLLILSNDGQFAHNTLSPKKHVTKVYLAHINGKINAQHIDIFKQGIIINDGYKCLGAKLDILSNSSDFSKVNIEIQEGKFHQIKRMFEAIDKNVIYLKRIKFGDIELDKKLKQGEYRELNDKEMEFINRYKNKD